MSKIGKHILKLEESNLVEFSEEEQRYILVNKRKPIKFIVLPTTNNKNKKRKVA